MLTELEALIILSSIPQLGSVKIRTLVQQFGSAVNALEASPEQIAALPDFGPKTTKGLNEWRSNNSWKKNIELAERHQANIISYTHPLYPKRLLEIPDFPILLYIKGEFIPADQRCIAVVGTRQASIYGLDMAERISQDLANMGFTVVSGLARGIDTAAHVGALRRGRTVAVIGSGLADVYPKENLALAQAIAERGVLMSEFPMETPPDRQNFPQRNRIVSGMTMATLLIEAPIKSGAMITMEKAFAYKRKLFAMPGRVDNDDFRGNHLLIKSGRAILIESAKDIVASFENLFGLVEEFSPAKRMSTTHLNDEELELYTKLPIQESSIDQIMQLTKLPVMKINVLLMGLVMKKVVREFPGKIYKKVNKG